MKAKDATVDLLEDLGVKDGIQTFRWNGTPLDGADVIDDAIKLLSSLRDITP